MTDYDEAELDFVLPPREQKFYGTVVKGMKQATNAKAWAIGAPMKNGFRVRRVVWGKVLAREERRPGEQIRKATICIGAAHSR